MEKAEVIDVDKKEKAEVTSPPTVLEGPRGDSSEETTPEMYVKEQRESTLPGAGVQDLSLRFDTAEKTQTFEEWEAVAQSVTEGPKKIELATMPKMGVCLGLQEVERPRQQTSAELDHEELSKWEVVARNLSSKARVIEFVAMPQLGSCSGLAEKQQEGGKLEVVGNDKVIGGVPPYSATVFCVGVPVDPKENYAGFSGCLVRMMDPRTRRPSTVVLTAAHCLHGQQRVYVFPECPDAADLPKLSPSKIWVTKNPTNAYVHPDYQKPPTGASDQVKFQAAAKDIAAFRLQPVNPSKKAKRVDTLSFGLSNDLQNEDPDRVLTVGFRSAFLREDKRANADDIPTADQVVLWHDVGQLVPVTVIDQLGEISEEDIRGVLIKSGEAEAGMSGGPWADANDRLVLGGVQSSVSESRHWVVSPRLDIAVMDNIMEKLA